MTAPQHILAFEKANRIRVERAALRKQIKAGDLGVGALLSDPPECVLRMRVYDLLVWQRNWGDSKASSLLWRCHISYGRRLGELTARQHGELVSLFASAEEQSFARRAPREMRA